MRSCANCASDDLVSIALSSPADPLEFHHCRRCEYRWWASATSGDALALDAVLALSSR